jgi:hypothetical protein
MLGEQNKRERLIFVCNLLNIAGWGCLLLWLLGLYALPSIWATWLTKAQQAKEVEVRDNILEMISSQSTVYKETGKWAASMDQLGVGIKSKTENYDYSIIVSHDKKSAFHLAIPRKRYLNMYVGIVWEEEDPNKKQSYIHGRMCKNEFRFGCVRDDFRFKRPVQLEKVQENLLFFHENLSNYNNNWELCDKILSD